MYKYIYNYMKKSKKFTKKEQQLLKDNNIATTLEYDSRYSNQYICHPCTHYLDTKIIRDPATVLKHAKSKFHKKSLPKFEQHMNKLKEIQKFEDEVNEYNNMIKEACLDKDCYELYKENEYDTNYLWDEVLANKFEVLLARKRLHQNKPDFGKISD